MALSPGTKLGSYEIVAPLGAGGMGEVYRARDVKLKRDVAVKVLPADVAADPQRLGRFEREAHLLAALNHPNIASIYGLEDAGGPTALIMELVEGESLAEKIARGPLSVSDSTAIARQVAEALEYAHERGIIHRDLKPANIVISRDGGVKVLDFGLAKAITGELSENSDSGATHSPTLTSPATRAGVILGTAAYMSPEQARGKTVDRRADIWAFGVVLFEMLTGRRMFEGETISDTIAAILTRAPAFELLPQDTPPSIRRLLIRCLERDPKQRLRDIGEARIVLDAAARGVGEEVSAPATTVSRRPSRVPWIVAGLAVVLAAAWTLLSNRNSDVTSTTVKYSQRSFRPQTIFQALYAPDGETIVYSGAPTGNTPYLYTLRTGYTEPLKVSDEPLLLLSISTRGELAVLKRPLWIAHRLCSGTLARMPLSGGAPREIMENVIQATWAPDGNELAIGRVVDGVYRLEYPPGKVLVQTGAYFSDMRFSPDGKHIAFFEHPAKWDDRGGIAVVDLEGKRTLLADGYWGEEGIAWSTDGSTVYFSAGTGYSDFSVQAVPIGGGTPRVAAQSAGGLIIHDVSPGGPWLATRDDLSRVMLVRAPGSDVEADLSWQELSHVADLSRDGRTILFTEFGTSAGANYLVGMRSTDGSPVVVLGEGHALDLTEDGRLALAGIHPNRLLVYPTGAGSTIEIKTGVARVTDARWLVDGQQILIVGGEEGGGDRCYVQDVSGSAALPLEIDRVYNAYPSPDAKRLLVIDLDQAWWIVPIDGSAQRNPVPGIAADDWFADWREDGNGVYVFRRSAVPSTLDFVDLSSGVRRVVYGLDPNRAGVLYFSAVAVAPGESVYAYDALTYVSRLFTMEGAR